jgi:anti-sigma regulatory factor (Ser/Thr protein kinase)
MYGERAGLAGAKYSCELPATARSVTEARRFVLDALANWRLDALADTAALLTSEIVTNAVLHARTPMDLVVQRLRDGVAVEVTDGSRKQPRARRVTPDSTNGRGMALLEQLASTWGVTVHRAGKTVRFTVTGDRDPWAAFTSAGWAVDQ